MQLRTAIPYWLEDQTNGLSSRFRRLLTGLWEDLLGLDKRLKELDAEIALIAETDPTAKRLQQLRGVGPMIATAMVATVGSATQFANGRQMAAALGLTPRQNSSGGKERLLGISKRGNKYVRVQLIYGARAAMAHFVRQTTPTGEWVRRLVARAHPNVVVVALAAKLARIAWAVLRHRRSFDRQALLAA